MAEGRDKKELEDIGLLHGLTSAGGHGEGGRGEAVPGGGVRGDGGRGADVHRHDITGLQVDGTCQCDTVLK